MSESFSIEEIKEELTPVKVKRAQSTGTAELKAIATAVEKIVSIAEKVAADLDKPRSEREITENFGKDGAGAATDITLINTLGSLLDKTAKIAGTKHRMSSGDYTPTATVVAKGQRTVDMVSNLLKEHLGPVAGQAVVNQFIEELVEVWNE